jgi:hypothetical protein
MSKGGSNTIKPPVEGLGGQKMGAPVVGSVAETVQSGADSATSAAKAVRAKGPEKEALREKSVNEGMSTVTHGVKTAVASRFGPAGEAIGGMVEKAIKPAQDLAAKLVNKTVGKVAFGALEKVDGMTGGRASKMVEGIGGGVSQGAGIVKGVSSGDLGSLQGAATTAASQANDQNIKVSATTASANTPPPPAAAPTQNLGSIVNDAGKLSNAKSSSPTTSTAGNIGNAMGGITDMLGKSSSSASTPSGASSGPSSSANDIGSVIGAVTDLLGKKNSSSEASGPSATSSKASSLGDLSSLVGKASSVVEQAQGMSSKMSSSSSNTSSMLDSVKTVIPQASKAAETSKAMSMKPEPSPSNVVKPDVTPSEKPKP